MGRPIKPAFVGKPTDYTDGRKVIVFSKAWIPGATAVSTAPVYIIKQTGANRYLVSDGTTTGNVYLVDGVPSEVGQGSITVTHGTETSFARKITIHRVDTFDGTSFAWNFDGTSEATITSLNASEYTTAITPVTPPAKTTVDPSTVVQEGSDGSVEIPVTDSGK